jgi:hypothetical protein
LAAETSSSKLSVPAILIILLAALGIGPPLLNGSRVLNAPPTPAVPTHPSLSTESDNSVIRPRSALALLDDFFDLAEVRKQAPSSNGAGPSIPGERSWPRDDARNGYAITFLIATLRAPASPPLREFDAFLDAMQLALGRSGYTVDSFALPWLGKTALANDAGKHDEAHRSGGISGNRRAIAPGALLFHRAADRRLLTLFVVEETPTHGIAKEELRDALDQIASLAGWKAADNLARPAYLSTAAQDFRTGNEIRIVGPIFSGSALSIRAVLDEWCETPVGANRKIRMISGTSTAVGSALDDMFGQRFAAPRNNSGIKGDTLLFRFAARIKLRITNGAG